jgi:hypothetical protein
VSVQVEDFNLRNHGAQDLGRYDFIKDIQRLEKIKSQKVGVKGFAILLTNVSSYWMPTQRNRTVDADFRLEDGRQIAGELEWKGASEGTMCGRKDKLMLNGSYPLKWEDYSTIGAEQFRYLLIEI